MNTKISVVGASGFLGSHLINYLLENTDWKIIAISPDPENLKIQNSRLDNLKGDVFETDKLADQIAGSDVVYYLVHMMAAKGDYYRLEEKASHSIGKAAVQADVGRIVNMSGLGNDKDNLSKHLASRHNAGRVLREYDVESIEFRASMVIGKGSISFQIVKNLVEKLSILPLPSTAKTKTQPIGISDMLEYLYKAASVDIEKDEVIEVGGPEVMSYEELLDKYAKWSKHSTHIFCIPLLPAFIFSWMLTFFNSSEVSKVGRAMVDSFRNEMIVTNNRAEELFPSVEPKPIESDFS